MQFKELVDKYLRREISEGEKKELAKMLESPVNQLELAEMIDGSFSVAAGRDVKGTVDSEKIYALLRPIASPAKVIKGRFSARLAMTAVAASVILLITLFLLFNKTKTPEKQIAKVDVEAPKVTKARITLADGRTVAIDSLSSLKLDNVQIVKSADSKITYSGAATENVYNTLTNPRGSKVVDLTLSDGTRVWLNSESSLKYPVAFVGNERTVEITGEAYFEAQPLKGGASFKVIANGIVVEDLGTEFNVNSYEIVKTTLIKGKVKVGNILLKPGEMTENEKLIGSVDVDEVTAWKNGLFQFNRATLSEVMKQISRWYDVEVSYEGAKSNETFSGIVSRSSNVSQVLKILEQAGVKFEIENKRIIIK